jgi:hypothetical protein
MPTSQELADTRRLHAWVAEHHYVFERLRSRVVHRVCEDTVELLPASLVPAAVDALAEILKRERYLYSTERDDLTGLTLKELTQFRAFLFQQQYIIHNEEHCEDLLYTALRTALIRICVHAPRRGPSPFSVPLINLMPDPALAVEMALIPFFNEAIQDRKFFTHLTETLRANMNSFSGRKPGSDKPIVWPTASELPPAELVDTYLAGTPFAALFKAPVPLELSYEERFNHTHIIGGTGAGKTSLIETLILHDLRSPDPPSLVIVDPHGDLIQKLTRADLGIEDRLIVVDPRDLRHPPALNVFALNKDRMQRYDDTTREQVVAGVIQTFDYLFSGLIGADLTAKQGIFFKYVARLMLSLPETLGRNATILDMIRLMADDGPYRPAIARLPPLQREFFQHDFNTKTFAQTKEQIRYRLQAIVENPTLANLFTAPETKLDLFTEMNRGSIILVDTAKDFLKGGSANFGRIFISLVLQAVLERAALPERDRKPTFLIVDEAASYFDSNIDDLLTEARKYRCGLVLAHQYLDQASSSLRASLAANAGIKFAAGISAGDARAMASEMRTTQDFILSQPKLHFAAHIRNTTPQAVSIPVRPGALSAVPQLSQQAIAAMLERNRARVSLQETPLPRSETVLYPHAAEPPEDNTW